MEKELAKVGDGLSRVGKLSDDLDAISVQFSLMIEALREAGE